VSVAPGPYIGLVTRAVAFALDAAIINGIALVVSGGVALIATVLHLGDDFRKVLLVVGAAAYLLWTLGYFIGFWSSTGQTPGARVMRFRIVESTGERLIPRRALVRCIGLVLAALPLFAGYFMILFDARRRGLQDRLARTLAVDAPTLSLAEQRRAARSPQTDDAAAADLLHA
jgi:uncharacterized RDD family membrane protein YckC